MKTIDLIGIMKTVASVTPLDGESEFLVKYGNHKQVVIAVKEAAQPSVQRTGGTLCHDTGIDVRVCNCSVCIAMFPAAGNANR